MSKKFINTDPRLDNHRWLMNHESDLKILPSQFPLMLKLLEEFKKDHILPEDIGKLIKRKRISLKISLNKMSNDLYGSRYRVNWLSNIENGKLEPLYSTVIKHINYLNEKTNG